MSTPLAALGRRTLAGLLDDARGLGEWLANHAGLLFLATVGAYAQLSYDLYGPPAHLVLLPALATSVFLALPLWGAVVHDTRDAPAWGLASAGLAAAMGPVLWWSYGPGGKELFKADPRLVAAGAVAGTGLALMAAVRGGLDWEAWGLAPGDHRWWRSKVALLLGAIAVGIPLTVWAFPEFAAYYPRYKPARTSVVALLQYDLGMGVYMFVWEFYYRGFLLFGLGRRLGPTAAILVQAYPFFLLHQHKPEPEMISSWFGGILMGALCWRARSMWPSFLLHWVMYATMEVSAFVARSS